MSFDLHSPNDPYAPLTGRMGYYIEVPRESCESVSHWFATSDQAEKNRWVKKILSEKEGHDANSNAHFP